MEILVAIITGLYLFNTVYNTIRIKKHNNHTNYDFTLRETQLRNEERMIDISERVLKMREEGL